MIAERLDAWGEAKLRERDGGRARCQVSSIYAGRERVQCADSSPSVALGDPEIALTDALVVRLATVDRALHAAVRTVHLDGRHRSLRANARNLSCSHTALAARLARADLMLLGWLREHAAALHRDRERELAVVAPCAQGAQRRAVRRA